MAITMKLETRRLNQVRKQLDSLPDRIKEGAQAAVEESGEAVREQVERTVGVYKGRLKNDVRVRQIGVHGLTADVGWFADADYYAQFVEFGTSKIEANPVLTRAAEEERARFPRRVRKHVSDKL